MSLAADRSLNTQARANQQVNHVRNVLVVRVRNNNFALTLSRPNRMCVYAHSLSLKCVRSLVCMCVCVCYASARALVHTMCGMAVVITAATKCSATKQTHTHITQSSTHDTAHTHTHVFTHYKCVLCARTHTHICRRDTHAKHTNTPSAKV